MVESGNRNRGGDAKCGSGRPGSRRGPGREAEKVRELDSGWVRVVVICCPGGRSAIYIGDTTSVVDDDGKDEGSLLTMMPNNG